MFHLGFSTGGILNDNISLLERIAAFSAMGCKAIELHDQSTLGILSANKSVLDSFDWVSLHYSGEYGMGRNDQTKRALERMEQAQRIFNFKLIVFHPDWFDDFSVLNDYNIPVGIENMDPHKKNFQSAESLKPIFSANPNFKFVLDLNHCYVNDPSLKLAKELIDAFGDKVAEIHLSGYEKLHEALYQTKQTNIIDARPKENHPLILEGGFLNFDDANKEFKYVLNALNSSQEN